MKERGIIFNTEMVRAILDGRKTVTRRPVKPQPFVERWISNGATMIMTDNESEYSNHPEEEKFTILRKNIFTRGSNPNLWAELNCPFGQIGDRLYVRETWALDRAPLEHEYLVYRADGHELETAERWTPSIHMPKWAARIWLEITDVRVERVQDITKEDAQAEGIPLDMAYECNGWGPSYYDPDSGGDPDYIAAFEYLWDSIYKNWSDNQWVWVVEFKRITS